MPWRINGGPTWKGNSVSNLPKLWFRVIDPELQQLCREALADMVACHMAYIQFARSIGARSYLNGPDWEKPCRFGFDRGVSPPPDWTKPSGRNNASHPKKSNKVAWAQIEALPSPKETQSSLLARLNLPTHVAYQDEQGSGWSYINSPFDAHGQLGWTTRDFFVTRRDHRPMLAELRQTRKGVSLLPEGSLEDFPTDKLEMITEAQFNLLFAEDEVRLETEGRIKNQIEEGTRP